MLGAAAGLFAGGPFGAIAGAGIGQAWGRGWLWPQPPSGELQTELRLMFELMGHLAKADGRVSKREVAFAEGLMERFQLSAEGRRSAIAAFGRGRDPDFRLDLAIDQLEKSGMRGTAEAEQLVGLLTRLAQVDAPLVPAEKGALERIATRLGVDQQRRKIPSSQTTDITWTATSAHAELGLATQASSDLIRSAYKRLMSRYHPDKLAARELSDAQRAAAEDRLRRIRSAYEFLRSRS